MKRLARSRWQSEATLGDKLGVMIALMLLSLLPSLSKFGIEGDSNTGSLLSQVVWGLIYIGAAIKLVGMRLDFLVLVKRSIPLVGFVAMALLSSTWSVDPWVSVRNAVEIAGTTAVCYYVVVRFRLSEFLDVLGLTFGAIASLSLLLVVAWPTRGRDWQAHGWCGLYSEKNGLGAAMALAILTFALPLFTARGNKRTLLVAGLALALVLLVGAQSITAMVTSFITLAIIGVIFACQSPKIGVFARFVCLSGLGIVSIAIAINGFNLDGLFGLVGRNSTLTGRADFWPGVVRAIGDRPFFGFGYNAFFITPAAAEPYLANLTGWWYPYHAHNSYYQMLLSIGFVGTGIFVLAIVTGAFFGAKFMGVRDPICSWPVGIMTYLLLAGFTETYFGIPNTIESICFMIALLYPLRPEQPRVNGSTAREADRWSPSRLQHSGPHPLSSSAS